VETKLAPWPVTHVDAVEREHVQVHVESERAVSALHGGDGTWMRVSDAWEPELFLCSPPQEATELADEGARDERA